MERKKYNLNLSIVKGHLQLIVLHSMFLLRTEDIGKLALVTRDLAFFVCLFCFLVKIMAKQNKNITREVYETKCYILVQVQKQCDELLLLLFLNP